MRKHFLWIVFFGLLIRFGVMFLDFSWDVNNHMSWAADLWDPRRGFGDFYYRISAAWFATKYPNYPPLAMYMFYLILPIQKLIEGIVWQLNTTIPLFPSTIVFFVQSRVFMAGLFKVPAIIADVALATILYRFAKQHSGRDSSIPLFAASAVLLNPAFFYNSAYWGQIDSIPLLFATCSLIVLINKKMPVVSAILMITSLLFKPTTIIFVPFYAFFFYKQYGGRNIAYSIIFSAALFFITFIPFVNINSFIHDAITLYSNNILMAQSLKYSTNGAFNVWAIISGLENTPLDTTRFFFGASYQQWGIVFSMIFLALVSYFSKNIKKYSYRIPYIFALTAIGMFIFLTRMHERYSILPLPFLIMAAIQNRRLVPLFWILSGLSFLNLYKSWPVPHVEILLSFVSHRAGYSLLSVVLTLIATRMLLKENRVEIKKKS